MLAVLFLFVDASEAHAVSGFVSLGVSLGDKLAASEALDRLDHLMTAFGTTPVIGDLTVGLDVVGELFAAHTATFAEIHMFTAFLLLEGGISDLTG